MEKRITKWCQENKVRPFDKMCYYIEVLRTSSIPPRTCTFTLTLTLTLFHVEGVKRKISADLVNGSFPTTVNALTPS